MQSFRWINIAKGFGMGSTDLIPGISGGTIALLLGIYDDFISSISGLFSKRFWPSFKFLLPILIGMGVAIGILSNLINYLLEHHQVVTMFFFTGLIIGIIPYLLRTSNFKETFHAKHYGMLAIGIIILIIITLMNSGEQRADTSLHLSFSLIIKYFLAGVCASSAMLLPGISGSFMLLVFGTYGTIMLAIADLVKLNFDGLPILLIVGLGVIVGFLLSSRIIRYFLHHHFVMTFALITGLVIGSIYAVFPGLPSNSIEWIMSIITLILGFIASYWIGQITAENE
ncbi:DUF368 domain-containing protein [Staphylococcus sp. NRL 21/187]|nr:DUF368 domain-containing protein [Staphylococcus sp. NRL 21/187]MCJ1656833.1 DUF368 domain-containing protein [Staphylococcus sp. NRL 21/187]